MFRACLFLLSCLLLGCETTGDLYAWGHYEALVYKMYNDPDQAPPEMQIDVLSQDIAAAESRGYMSAPGLHAHLGMLYAAVGNMGAAQQELTKEKLLFPESAVLIDGMLERAKLNFSEKDASK